MLMGRTRYISAVDPEDTTWGWCLASAAVMAVGYGLYLVMYLSGGIVPNPTTWSLWAFGGLIEAWSFRKLVRETRNGKTSGLTGNPKNLWEWVRGNADPLELPSWMCAIFAIIIAGIGIVSAIAASFNPTLAATAFAWPDRWELAVAAGDIIVVVTYIVVKAITKNSGAAAKAANLLLVLDIFLSFLPIWWSTYQDPSAEHPLPWFIWALGSYSIIAVAVLVNPGHDRKERPWLLLYPVASAFFHGYVGYLALH